MIAAFFDLRSDEKKGTSLLAAINEPGDLIERRRYEVDPSSFRNIPLAPFAYWAPNRVRQLFKVIPSLQDGLARACDTNPHGDDSRFVRASWEPALVKYGRFGWLPLCKGGSFSPFYNDVHLSVAWDSERRTYPGFVGTTHRPLEKPASVGRFLRPGLTWSRRSQVGLSVRAMPKGCIFGQKGPGIFVDRDCAESLLALLAIANSSPFRHMVSLQMAFGAYEVGVLNRTPVPPLTAVQANQLSNWSGTIWSRRRSLATSLEHSRDFVLPALIQVAGQSIGDRASVWADRVASTEKELVRLRADIDDCCYEIYGVKGIDRHQIALDLGGVPEQSGSVTADVAEDNEEAELDGVPLVASLLSWAVGVAFGRFDLRLATGERSTPPEPGPFDPLPVCSPGMLTGGDGLPLDTHPAGYRIGFPRDGILVEDAGAERDLVAMARQVFDPIFDDSAARWDEAADILGDRERSLRRWFAHEFFKLHIKRYSKSRRKAPIYWQLATPSASYSAWLYYHRFTRDTLFRLLNDHVAPKLQHEERKLTNLTQDAGPDHTASQRKDIDAHETLVGELRAFRDEVARVAPLWNPNLNDGVILNFAPLWRLVPQHKAWQKECKSAWDKLCKGDYDWAHLAMHLWPERVVLKCARDRSLAIAHGLEEVFWREDQDGRWQPKTVSDEEVEALVAERTSPAVKASLRSLLDAPAPVAGRGLTPRRKKATTRRTKAAAPSDASVASREQTPRQSTSTRIPDDNVLDQIRSAIATLGGNAAKSDILESTSLSASQWTPAINALLAEGSVTKTGQKRGTRYHLAQDPS